MSDCIDHSRTRGLAGNGYLQVRYKGNMELAHRVAYCEARQIPIEYIKGSVIRHTCDNPRCINPQHLLIGTHRDNVDDKVHRNRQAKGVSIGVAKLTEQDVLYIRKHYKLRCKEYSGRVLARHFGVSPATISNIVNFKVWAYL